MKKWYMRYAWLNKNVFKKSKFELKIQQSKYAHLAARGLWFSQQKFRAVQVGINLGPN
jgi:hypothetical protein